MGGWSRGLRAPLGGIPIVAVILGAGLGDAGAQQTLDPITVLATRTIEKTIEALAMVSSVRQEQLDQIQPKRVADMFYGLPSVWFRERADTPEFRQALLRTEIDSGLFLETVGKIDFLGDRLFRTTLAFPANVPTGTYSVEIFLLRQGEVVSAQTTPLVVSKIGIDAQVYDFADRQAFAYGLIAALIAVMAGWLASLPFRSA